MPTRPGLGGLASTDFIGHHRRWHPLSFGGFADSKMENKSPSCPCAGGRSHRQVSFDTWTKRSRSGLSKVLTPPRRPASKNTREPSVSDGLEDAIVDRQKVRCLGSRHPMPPARLPTRDSLPQSAFEHSGHPTPNPLFFFFFFFFFVFFFLKLAHPTLLSLPAGPRLKAHAGFRRPGGASLGKTTFDSLNAPPTIYGGDVCREERRLGSFQLSPKLLASACDACSARTARFPPATFKVRYHASSDPQNRQSSPKISRRDHPFVLSAVHFPLSGLPRGHTRRPRTLTATGLWHLAILRPRDRGQDPLPQLGQPTRECINRSGRWGGELAVVALPAWRS